MKQIETGYKLTFVSPEYQAWVVFEAARSARHRCALSSAEGNNQLRNPNRAVYLIEEVITFFALKVHVLKYLKAVAAGLWPAESVFTLCWCLA